MMLVGVSERGTFKVLPVAVLVLVLRRPDILPRLDLQSQGLRAKQRHFRFYHKATSYTGSPSYPRSTTSRYQLRNTTYT